MGEEREDRGKEITIDEETWKPNRECVRSYVCQVAHFHWPSNIVIEVIVVNNGAS